MAEAQTDTSTINPVAGRETLPQPVRLDEQAWPAGTIPVVSICCITYNHASFIRESLEGFLMQETTFPVEIWIHDDASTDDTAVIIREYVARYPALFKPIYQTENQYSKGVNPGSRFVFPRASGEFIAICEGDDYWIDSRKLEKQVALLRLNSSYSLCWTRFETVEEDSGVRVLDQNSQYFHSDGGAGFDFHVFCKGWHIGMPTLMFRRQRLDLHNVNNPQYKDVFLISDLLTKGQGFCLPNVMAIYRVHGGGVYSSRNELQRAEIGARTYREIYLAHRGNEHLRLKYQKFCSRYSDLLFHNGLYREAISVIDEFFRLTSSSSDAIDPQLLLYLEQKLRTRDRELSDLRRSWAFRIGRAMTLPVRQVRGFVARGRSAFRMMIESKASEKR